MDPSNVYVITEAKPGIWETTKGHELCLEVHLRRADGVGTERLILDATEAVDFCTAVGAGLRDLTSRCVWGAMRTPSQSGPGVRSLSGRGGVFHRTRDM